VGDGNTHQGGGQPTKGPKGFKEEKGTTTLTNLPVETDKKLQAPTKKITMAGVQGDTQKTPSYLARKEPSQMPKVRGRYSCQRNKECFV